MNRASPKNMAGLWLGSASRCAFAGDQPLGPSSAHLDQPASICWLIHAALAGANSTPLRW